MPVIIDINKIGDTKDIEKALSNLNRRISTQVLKKLTNRNTRSIKKLHTTMKNSLGEAMSAPTEEVTTNIESVRLKKNGKQLGAVTTKKGTAASVIRAYTGANNPIVLQFPEMSTSKGIVIKPAPGDLIAKKDGRTKNTWNIHLSTSAIKKYKTQLELAVYTAVNDEVVNVLSGKRNSGIAFQIAAKLGVSADSVTVVSKSGVIGTDISRLVQDEVKRRMSKSGVDDRRLNYRTGGFVNSIKARISSNKMITYSFDQKHYGIHEEAKGNSPKGKNYTRIKAKAGKVLSFINKKTGQRVFTRYVDVRQRPVIRQSIRAIAFKHFNKEFRLRLR